jgi:protein gp37
MLDCSSWDYGWNPFVGCDPIRGDPSCAVCYAQFIVANYKWPDENGKLTRGRHEGVTKEVNGTPVWNGHVIVHPYDDPIWQLPYHVRLPSWREPNLGRGMPLLAFNGDISDCGLVCKRVIPGTSVKVLDRCIETMFCVGHIAMFSTKRPERLAAYLQQRTLRITQECVWPGTSAPNQHWLNIRLPHLLAMADSGYQTFLYVSPLMEAVVMPKEFLKLGNRTWVICGGQQPTGGQRMRIMDPDWAWSLRVQCREAGVPFWFLQMSNHEAIPFELEEAREVPKLR